MFYSTENKGFQIAFQNGYVISCQFGTTNYCSRQDLEAPYGVDRQNSITSCENCEVAIWKKSIAREWITAEIISAVFPEDDGPSGDDYVCGWVTPEQVAKIIAYLATAEA